MNCISIRHFFLFATILLFGLSGAEKSNGQTWYPDRSFGENGLRTIDFNGSRDASNTLVKTPDGKLLFSADGPTINVGLFIKTARINPLCGINDSTYGINGQTNFQLDAANYLNHIRVLPDGKILGSGLLAPPGGAVSALNPFFCRLKADGSLDSTFRGTGFHSERFDPTSGGEYFDSYYYPDGRMLAIGKSYKNINGGTLGIGLTRFLPDGSLDTSLNGSGRKVLPIYAFGAARGFVHPQSGTMYIITQEEVSNLGYPRIAKFNHRGQAVLNFGLNGIAGLSRWIYANDKYCVFPQGSKLLAFYTIYLESGSKATVQAVRLDSTTGLPDSSFGTNGELTLLAQDPASFNLSKIQQLPDGRFLLIGQRNVGNGIAALYCLKPDLSIDSSFGSNGSIEYDLPGVYGEAFTDAAFLNDSTLYILGYNPGVANGDALLFKYRTSPNNWFFLGADRSICGNATQTLNAGFPGSSYQWNTGAVSQSISADTSGQYSVRIKEPGGCSAYDTIRVSYNPFPSVPVIVASGDSLICLDSGSFQWFRNDTALVNDTLRFIIPGQPGGYSVRITNAAGCSSKSLPFNLTSSHPVFHRNLSVRVSPNPFSSAMEVFLPGAQGRNLVSIYNIMGIKVLSYELAGEGLFSTTGLAPGTYLLRHEESGSCIRMVKP